MWKRLVDFGVRVGRKIVPFLKRMLQNVFGKTEEEQEAKLKLMLEMLQRFDEEYGEQSDRKVTEDGGEMIEGAKEEAPPVVMEEEPVATVKEEAEREEELDRGCFMSDPFTGGV